MLNVIMLSVVGPYSGAANVGKIFISIVYIYRIYVLCIISLFYLSQCLVNVVPICGSILPNDIRIVAKSTEQNWGGVRGCGVKRVFPKC
jgi:hypothetical protein